MFFFFGHVIVRDSSLTCIQMHIRAIVRFLHFEKLPTHKAQYKNTVLLCFDITAVIEAITPYDPQQRQKACKRAHDR